MMSNQLESFNNLAEYEKETILDFLFCFTEGDIYKLASEMSFDRGDAKRIAAAIDNFKEGC